MTTQCPLCPDPLEEGQVQLYLTESQLTGEPMRLSTDPAFDEARSHGAWVHHACGVRQLARLEGQYTPQERWVRHIWGIPTS